MSAETIVISQQRMVVEVRDESPTIIPVAASGPQGPPGPQGLAGTPGGSAYEYVLNVASATWIINHNLGRRVHVSIFDGDGVLIYSDVDHSADFNSTTITFSTPRTGSAVLS